MDTKHFPEALKSKPYFEREEKYPLRQPSGSLEARGLRKATFFTTFWAP
jgi:hypothetical protein